MVSIRVCGNFTVRRSSVTWELPNGTTLKIEATFGLDKNSARALLRFGFSYEIPRFDGLIRRWFR